MSEAVVMPLTTERDDLSDDYDTPRFSPEGDEFFDTVEKEETSNNTRDYDTLLSSFDRGGGLVDDTDGRLIIPRVEPTTSPLNPEVLMIENETQPSTTPTPPDHVTVDIKDDTDEKLTSPRIDWRTFPPHTEIIEEQPTPPPTSLWSLMPSFNYSSSSNSGSSEIQPDDQIETVSEAQQHSNETRPQASRALMGLRFVCKNSKGDLSLDDVETKFNRLAKHGYLYRAEFPECIGMENSEEFALKLFDACDPMNRRRTLKVTKICKDEFLQYWSQITDQSFDARLKLFFVMADKNGDGRLTKDEIKEIIMLSASACKLSRVEDKAEEHAASIMDELDEERLGYIKLRQLRGHLLEEDPFSGNSTRFSTLSVTFTESKGLRGEPVAGLNHPRDPRAGPSYKKLNRKTRTFLKDNWKGRLILGLWVSVMLALFVWKFNQYKHKAAFNVMGYCLTTAKGAAETLKFNMALVLFPVCRITLTWLRSTRLANIVPFDDNINFHKIVGGAIALGVIVHAGLHITCDFVKLQQSSEADFKLYLSEFSHHGHKPTYLELITGWEGVTGIIMVACLLIAFPLASWRNIKLPKPFDRFIGYNAFRYSHHLFIIVYICLFIHGTKVYLVHEWYNKTTWMYLAVPVLLYGGERLFRLIRYKSVRILKVGKHSDVVSLRTSKPPGFRYKSGQYVSVQCPAVSSLQWHPFSITSAPGDAYLSIHIRDLGDWTEAVHKKFTEAIASPVTDLSCPKLLIDGPYGAPAQDYHKYDVILLVGLGIGVTPFISILKDLINNFIENEEIDRLVEHRRKSAILLKKELKVFCLGQNVSNLEHFRKFYRLPNINMFFRKQKKTMKTTKAYFYWVTREQESFDWFREVMDEVAELDTRGIVEMHNYLTSVYEEGDARSAMIGLIQKIQHAKNAPDVVAGTKVRTYFDKPNWNTVIKELGDKHTNSRIGVFYCGRPDVAIQVKNASDEYNQIGMTKFEFHKENF